MVVPDGQLLGICDLAAVPLGGQPVGDDSDIAVSSLEEMGERRPGRASVIVTHVGHTSHYRLVDHHYRDISGERRGNSLVFVGERIERERVDGGRVDCAGRRSTVAGGDRDQQETYLGLLAGTRNPLEDLNGGRIRATHTRAARWNQPDGAAFAAGECPCGRVGPGVACLLRGAKDAAAQPGRELIGTVECVRDCRLQTPSRSASSARVRGACSEVALTFIR